MTSPPPWPDNIVVLRGAVYLDRAMSLALAHLTYGVPLRPTPQDVALLAEHCLALRTVRVGRTARSKPQDVTFLFSTLTPKERIETQPAFQMRQLAMLAAARPRLKAQLGEWVVQAHLPPGRDANNLFVTGSKPDVLTWPEGGHRINVEADSGKYTQGEIMVKSVTYAQDLNPQVWLVCSDDRRRSMEGWLGQAIPHIKHEVWVVDWLPDIPSDVSTSTMATSQNGLPTTPPLTSLQPEPLPLAAQVEAWNQAGVSDVSNTELAAALKITRGSAINYRNAWQTVLVAEGARTADDLSVVAPADVMVFAWAQEQLPWFQERASREGLLRAFLRGELGEVGHGEEALEVTEAPRGRADSVMPDDSGVTAMPAPAPTPSLHRALAPEQGLPTTGPHRPGRAVEAVAAFLLAACGFVLVLVLTRGLPPLSVVKAGPAALGWYVRHDAKQFFGSHVLQGWEGSRWKTRP